MYVRIYIHICTEDTFYIPDNNDVKTLRLENTFYREHILQRTHSIENREPDNNDVKTLRLENTFYREHILQRTHSIYLTITMLRRSDSGKSSSGMITSAEMDRFIDSFVGCACMCVCVCVCASVYTYICIYSVCVCVYICIYIVDRDGPFIDTHTHTHTDGPFH